MERSGNTGCIHVYTGDGKGKTTAAIGLAIRAAGCRRRVAFIFFDKGNASDDDFYSERNILRSIDEIDIMSFGTPRLMADGCFRFTITPHDIDEACKGFQTLQHILKNPDYFLIVADEIISCAARAMIDYDDLYELLRDYKQKPYAELVLTGRGASEKLIDMADLVTVMQNVKHYCSQKRPAIKGIDF